MPRPTRAHLNPTSHPTPDHVLAPALTPRPNHNTHTTDPTSRPYPFNFSPCSHLNSTSHHNTTRAPQRHAPTNTSHAPTTAHQRPAPRPRIHSNATPQPQRPTARTNARAPQHLNQPQRLRSPHLNPTSHPTPNGSRHAHNHAPRAHKHQHHSRPTQLNLTPNARTTSHAPNLSIHL